MKRNAISINHVKNDVRSFLKGYWDFISNENKSTMKGKKIYQYIKNLFSWGIVMCIISTAVLYFENVIVNYTGILRTETTRKPRDFNPGRGDYCTEDINGQIIKCVIEFPLSIKYFLMILIFVLMIILMIVLYVSIDIALNIIRKPIVNFLLILQASIKEYETFRKRVKNDIECNIVTIV